MKSRRQFLGTLAAGAAFLSSGVAKAANALSSPAGGLWINPSIDPLRVVCCYDEGMVTSKIASDFQHQNEGVNKELVEANMDKMAQKLTNIDSVSSAWATIFPRPAAKDWNVVKAAIKVNCRNIANMPRVAIVRKVCKELINRGVLPQNITIFDSCSNAWGFGKYTDAVGNLDSGLPVGVIVSNAVKDGPQVPTKSGAMQCSSVIATENPDHTISYTADILVNCAVNKGHPYDTTYGGFTMAMKNHVGTLKYACPTAQELIDINQSEAIIGQVITDVPCRQLLCIIDSLWASTTGPDGGWTNVPCRLVMGTLAPVVDFKTAENLRKNIMKADYNLSVVNTWLASFGYSTPMSPSWTEISPSTEIASLVHARDGMVVQVALSGRASAINILMPASPHALISIEIFNLQGRLQSRMTRPPAVGNRVAVAWDGIGASGLRVPAGPYIVRCSIGDVIKEAVLLVS